MTIIYEIWSATDSSFCHSGLFFALLPPYGPRKSTFCENEKNTWRYYHFTNVYHKQKSYDVWFLRYGVQQTEFFVILGHFLPFYPPNNTKNQNFEKTKKALGDIIILHMCTINDNRMMYSSWNMEHDGQNFLSLLTIFCSFPPNNLNNQNFEKMKKLPRGIIILHMCPINDNHMIKHLSKQFY